MCTCILVFVCILVFICSLSNISTGVERTAGPIGIKFGEWEMVLNNGILNCYNLFCLILNFIFLISITII